MSERFQPLFEVTRGNIVEFDPFRCYRDRGHKSKAFVFLWRPSDGRFFALLRQTVSGSSIRRTGRCGAFWFYAA